MHPSTNYSTTHIHHRHNTAIDISTQPTSMVYSLDWLAPISLIAYIWVRLCPWSKMQNWMRAWNARWRSWSIWAEIDISWGRWSRRGAGCWSMDMLLFCISSTRIKRRRKIKRKRKRKRLNDLLIFYII